MKNAHTASGRMYWLTERSFAGLLTDLTRWKSEKKAAGWFVISGEGENKDHTNTWREDVKFEDAALDQAVSSTVLQTSEQFAKMALPCTNG